MKYVMEHPLEFERLEKQSTHPAYNYRKELSDLSVKPGDFILDVGCGSGVVSRYVAEKYPQSTVVGCDFGIDRIKPAREAGAHLKNLTFEIEDMTKLSFSNNTFDSIICRYVVEHLSSESRLIAMQELLRCLKPGGTVFVIDFDGAFFNIFPKPAIISKVQSIVENSNVIDLQVGRKIPNILTTVGFEPVSYWIETLDFQGPHLNEAIDMTQQKINNAKAFVEKILGSAEEARSFSETFISTLRMPGVVFFYNKFIVKAHKKSKLSLIR